MFDNPVGPAYRYPDVVSFAEVPVPDQQRRRTDVFCTICSAIFALILFIVACISFNNYRLKKMTFFIDSDGKTCAWDYKQTAPFLYYASLTDPTRRVCVTACPEGSQNMLRCHPTEQVGCGRNTNPKYEVNIYPTEPVINRIGLICLPKDQAQRDQVLKISGLRDKYNFLTIYDSIWTSIWVSIIFGALYIMLMQCIPRLVAHWMYILGFLTFLAIAISTFIVPQDSIFVIKLIVGIWFLIMAIMCIVSVVHYRYRKQIFICGRLLEAAKKIVKAHPAILIYIPIFFILQIGLIALTIFQILSFWSMSQLVYNPEFPFYQVSSFWSSFFSVLTYFQFIWGLCFLKEAFNFIVSGFATLYYCYQDQPITSSDPRRMRNPVSICTPLTRLLKYHWGSVVGGSLLLLLFYFIDLIVDFVSSTGQAIPLDQLNKNRVESGPFDRRTAEGNCCTSLFDLVRSQSFAYINLIPIPFCNASRYCQMLDRDSHFYDRSQTTNRLYRLSAHIFFITLATLISLGANNHFGDPIPILGILFIAIISLFTITYFIALHGDLAQGLYTSTVLQEKLYAISMGNVGLTSNPYWGPNERVVAARENVKRAPAFVRNVYYDDIAQIYQDSSIFDYLRAQIKMDYRFRSTAPGQFTGYNPGLGGSTVNPGPGMNPMPLSPRNSGAPIF